MPDSLRSAFNDLEGDQGRCLPRFHNMQAIHPLKLWAPLSHLLSRILFPIHQLLTGHPSPGTNLDSVSFHPFPLRLSQKALYVTSYNACQSKTFLNNKLYQSSQKSVGLKRQMGQVRRERNRCNYDLWFRKQPP